MGRIHRYGQQHDPVVIVNVIAGRTREGRVMRTLLDKLEAMRRQLKSDKVFDVIGRLFEGVSFKDYLQEAVTGSDPDAPVRRLEGRLTEEQVRALGERENALYGAGGDVRRSLDRLNEETEQEHYRRLLPGYVRRFVEKAAPLLGLRVEGDPGGVFSFAPDRPGALDPLLPALELHPRESRDKLTVYKPRDATEAIWLHPGEPVYDRLSAAILDRFGNDALKGAVFVDPKTEEPYLYHLALVTVEHGPDGPHTSPALPGDERSEADGSQNPKTVETRLVGLRQAKDGTVEESPVEHLLLLRGAPDLSPGRIPIAALAHRMIPETGAYVKEEVAESLVQSHRQRILDDLPTRIELISHGFDHQNAELAQTRARLARKAREGDQRAQDDLSGIKAHQRSLTALRDRRLEALRAEVDCVQAGGVAFLAHALVVPAGDSEVIERYDADIERIAVEVATAHEERFGAVVEDVSRPELARRAGLTDWPGFDLRSRRPTGTGAEDTHVASIQDEGTHAADAGAAGVVSVGTAATGIGTDFEERAIEVKGRAGTGTIEMSENEWAKACNLRDRYWLYVVFDCATPRPRLVRVRDPFARLIMRGRESIAYTVTPSVLMEAAEEVG